MTNKARLDGGARSTYEWNETNSCSQRIFWPDENDERWRRKGNYLRWQREFVGWHDRRKENWISTERSASKDQPFMIASVFVRFTYNGGTMSIDQIVNRNEWQRIVRNEIQRNLCRSRDDVRNIVILMIVLQKERTNIGSTTKRKRRWKLTTKIVCSVVLIKSWLVLIKLNSVS